jgi:hypothetical protein
MKEKRPRQNVGGSYPLQMKLFHLVTLATPHEPEELKDEHAALSQPA